MRIDKEIVIDGSPCPITISDDDTALLAARAAGRAVIGIWKGTGGPGLDQCLYLVTDPEDISEELLERAGRRHLGLPWIIARTPRLLIREFTDEDPLEEAGAFDGDGVFSDRYKRHAYIQHQYRIEERGIWALVLRKTGEIVGKAGITGNELSYALSEPWRHHGLAQEALGAVIDWWRKEEGENLYVRIDRGNLPSLHLAEKLGFQKIPGQGDCVYLALTL